MLENKKKFIDETGYDQFPDPSPMQDLVDMNIFFCYKRDNWNRPIQYTLVRNFVPAQIEDDRLKQFLFYQNYIIRSNFEEHIDSYLAIVDVSGMGKKNFSLTQFKKVLPDVGNYNPELAPVTFLVKPGFVMNMIYSMMKPFLHANTLAKLRFVKEKELA